MNHDETIKYYQMRAGEYDKVYSRDNPDRQDELAELYTLSRGTLKGRHVLDLACGTGYWTRLVSEEAGSIVGVDINRATLAEAEKKTYQCPVRFVLADVFNLPFAGNEFDGLLMTYLLSHIRRQDLDHLSHRIRNILKPGSPVFMCDNNLICEMKPDLIWDKEHINSYKKRILESGRKYQILKNYFEEDELSGILEKWGNVEKMRFNKYYWSAILEVQ
jgi:ubiquinone/menaquinone biosynthesis C-methylase UbiE